MCCKRLFSGSAVFADRAGRSFVELFLELSDFDAGLNPSETGSYG
jgi:hypothetical protein